MEQQSLRSTRIFVGRWREGDPAALGALVTRFNPLLRKRIGDRPAFQALRSSASVDDLLQEIWAEVLNAGPDAFRHQGKGSFVAWVGQIADHVVASQCRHKGARKRGGGNVPTPLDSLAEKEARHLPGGPVQLSPTAEVRLTEFEEAAAQVLQEREQIAWRWVAIEGYTSAEAALGLGMTGTAVRSMLARSRRKLQALLEERRRGG